MSDQTKPLIPPESTNQSPEVTSHSTLVEAQPDDDSERFADYLQHYPAKRSHSFLRRAFGPVKYGSLRFSLLIWIRMNLAIIIVVPYYFTYFGAMGGVAVLLFSFFVTYNACKMIFDCAIQTGISDFIPLAEELLPRPLVSLLKASLSMDYLGMLIYTGAFVWVVVEYFMLLFGLMKPEWIIDANKQQFREYNSSLFALRAIFFAGMFVTVLPLFLRRSMKSLKFVAMLNLALILVQTSWIIIECPFFRNYYEQRNQLSVQFFVKEPSTKWIPGLFNMALFYYVQPFCLFLRKELVSPSKERSRKLAAFGMLFQFFIYSFLGFFVYISFGENFLPVNVTLRLPYKDKSALSEIVFLGIQILVTLTNVLAMSTFNPGIREFFINLSQIKSAIAKFVFYSLFPLFVSLLICTVMPKITDIMNFYSLLICNYNGYMVPALMKAEIERRTKKRFLVISGLYLWVFLLVFFGTFGFITDTLSKDN